MSNEAQRRSRLWARAALLLIPIGAILGYFVAARHLCQPGDGHDWVVVGFMIGVPFGVIAGLVASLIVRANLAFR
jgi:hypothetical protein